MANVIKCPVCGESNLFDQEFCQYCQARLHPLTGNLKGADEPLKPGQAPTKKNTAELEPVLPQWLREARSTARQTSEEEAAQAAQQTQTSRPASGSDLLAGLQSQAQDNDEEDTPDWLANITGETPKTKKSQPESSEARWVELGATNDFAQAEPISDETPPWLADINPSASQPEWLQDLSDSQKPQQPSQPFTFDPPPSVTPSVPPTDDTPDWLHSMVADDGAFNDSENTVDEPIISSDTPDWLRAMDTENAAQNVSAPLSNSSIPPASSDTPDWLSGMVAKTDAQNVSAPLSNSGTLPASSEAPDWLRAMDTENTAQNASAPLSNSGTLPASSDTPDWLRAMDTENIAQKVSMPPVSSDDTPDWLRTMDVEDKTQGADSAGFSGTGLGASDAAPLSDGDTPDWLKGLESSASSSDLDWLKGIQSGESQKPAAAPIPVPEPQQPSDAEQHDDTSDIPSWLKAAAPQSSIFDEPVEQSPVPVPSSSDTPDWLDAFKSGELPEQAAAFSMDKPADSAPPTPVANAQPSANSDTLFTEMPDWLSLVDDSATAESTPTPITNVDAIAPGDLPSWVQAMRPVDTGVSQLSSSSLSGDKTLESRGALAGLQGVLPAVPGFSPTSKPKAYSIKMKASEEQQAHALLLEQILEAETAPVPIGSFSVLGTSRVLRWILALLLFAVVTATFFMQTPLFSMPVELPSEVKDALTVAQSIPEGAPLLVAFDYEPARVGEMEAAAAPMFDQMILLRHPHLTFITTNATGAILAERFISSGPLAGHNYQSGVQYLNLGYLPGGQMGIRAFAQDPQAVAPYALAQNPALFNATLAPAWVSDPWKGITSLSQFAALIVITDNADSAREWIEQTTSVRGATPLVVISSAQAAPMIRPYYESQQINGLVSGLYGGALFERNNADRPGTARAYWDAYSIGMLLAMVLILGGGLLNLFLGLRDRAAREAK